MSAPELTRNEDIDALDERGKLRLVAHTCAEVVAQPEKELPRLNTLFYLTGDASLLVVNAALLSLVEVFKEIVPLYPIDAERVRAELARTLAKEERRTLAFELELTVFYDKLLERLCEMRTQLAGQPAAKEFEQTRVRCLIELYKRLSHFNRALEILAAVLRCLARRSPRTRALVADFAGFLAAAESPRFYEAKLRLLEALGAASRTPALFARTPSEVWAAALEMRFAPPTLPARKDAGAAQADRLAKLRAQPRPSKRKQREIVELEKRLASQARTKPMLEDPRLLRELRAELRESSALPEEDKTRRLATQILAKKLTLGFNLLRRFPHKPVFDCAVRSVAHTLQFVDPRLFAAGLAELQKVFATVDRVVVEPARAVQQRLTLLQAFLDLSRLRAEDQETEDVYVPQSLFRTVVAAGADPALVSGETRLSLLQLAERVLLQRRALNLVVVENFLQALVLVGRAVAEDAQFGHALAALLRGLLEKYARLRGKLREEEEESATADTGRLRFGDVEQLLNEHFPYHAVLGEWARGTRDPRLRAELDALANGRATALPPRAPTPRRS